MTHHDAEKIKACMLYYRIPRGAMWNPSGFLRRFAVRVDGSVWIVPEDRIHLVPFSEWRACVNRHGQHVTVGVVRYSEDDAGAIRRLARVALESEATRLREYVAKGVAKAVAKFAAAERLQSADDTKKARRTVQSALSRAKRDIRLAEECALAFDVTGDVAELLQAVKLEIKSAHDAFYATKEPEVGAPEVAA